MRRKTDAEKLDALNRQYKQKNKYIAANYDRIGIVTPKGTRDYIKSLGMSANSYINGLIEADRKRREAAEDPEGPEHNLQGMNPGPAADHQQAKPQEAPQGTASGARTNRHEATRSAAEGRTEAQEGKTSAGAAEGSSRSRSRKASGANRSPQETTGGPEEGTTAGSPAGSPDTARREPVEDAENGTKGSDAPQPINPGYNLQQHYNPYKYNSENVLLYPYGMDDDIPPEELPFH